MSVSLGQSLPVGDEHAISVSFPRWRDTVGWGKQDPSVVQKLQTGYPRFYVPRLVRDLEDAVMKRIKLGSREDLGDYLRSLDTPGQAIKLLPAQGMANACRIYVLKNATDKDAEYIYVLEVRPNGQVMMAHGAEPTSHVPVGQVLYVVVYPKVLERNARDFWQHTGYGISSRFAQFWLQNTIFSPIVVVTRRNKGVELPICASTAANELRGRIATLYSKDGLAIEETSDVFLYQSGMTAIVQAALALQECQHAVGKVLRVAVFGLTKMFSGACNVMGGSVVLNPRLRHDRYEALRAALSLMYIDTYFPLDVIVMNKNSTDFEKRMAMANRNAEYVADLLRSHEAVSHVFYPKGSPTQHHYDKYKRKNGEYGYLVSVCFTSPNAAVAFHDELDVAKGPSLGTNFTLASPYTLLAHSSELEWAEQHGMSEHLVRISVGLEAVEHLRDVVHRALRAAERQC